MSNIPVNALPEFIRETIYDIAEHTQAPRALIASSVISALSLAC